MFLHKKRGGHFLESERLFGNYYGTPNKNVRDLLRTGKNVLLCIDVNGAKNVCRRFPKAVTIFIKTKSLAVLAARLKGRGSEQKSALSQRLKTAKKELREAKKYKYVVINDNLRVSYHELESVIASEISYV
jgi:guanylate kinase